MVPGSDDGASLIDRMCGSGMDLDLPVKDFRALNDSPTIFIWQQGEHAGNWLSCACIAACFVQFYIWTTPCGGSGL